MKKIILLLLSFIVTINIQAQEDCICCKEPHKQFDFWIGEWNVYDTLGNILGENRIEKIEKGCALKESWKSVKGNTGTSLNYYDTKDSTWNQLWISIQGKSLTLKGNLNKEGVMILSSAYTTRPSPLIGYYKDQLSWSKNKDGSITQWWLLVKKDSKQKETIFKGIYRRKD